MPRDSLMKPSAFFRPLAHFSRRLLAVLTVAMTLLVALGGYAFYSLGQQAAAADWVTHTYQVVTGLQAIFSSVQDAESSQRAFLVSGNETYLEPCHRALQVLPGQFEEVRTLIQDNPSQLVKLNKLRQDVSVRLATVNARIEQRRQLGMAALNATVLNGTGVRLMEVVRSDMDSMIRVETTLLRQRRATLATARFRQTLLQSLVGLVSLGLFTAAFIGLARQISRASRAESAAESSNVLLRNANGELRAFSYSVAHDLRAPLRAINGFSQVLQEDCAGQLDDVGRRALERIVANSKQMAVLIDDLLALSAVTMRPLTKGKVEMNEVVRAAYEELRDAQDGRTIECAIAPLPPASGDPSLLRQVWINLIGNALKFTRGREVTRIEIGGNVAGPDFATYFIRDNGAGFDMQYADKLFGAFQRLHLSADFEGTGIGLALVQRIVQRHGGTIWAESEENQGARFAFTLPEWAGS